MQVDFFVCSLQSETVKRVDNDSDVFYLMIAELTSSVWSPEFRLKFPDKTRPENQYVPSKPESNLFLP